MVTGLGNKADENSENFNKETETIEKHQSEIKNITEMKNTLAGIKSRLCDTEERMHKPPNQNSKKRNKFKK